MFVSLVLFNKITFLFGASSFLTGAIFPGLVTLVSARIVELIGTESHPIFWGRMTVSFAITQAIAAYGMSHFLHKGMDYTICFIIAGIAFAVGLIIIIFAKTKTKKYKRKSLVS